MIVQNMQDYLKYLLLNVNAIEFSQSSIAQNNMNLPPTSEEKVIADDQRNISIAQKNAHVKNQKSSRRLWNLMFKRYSTKKVKPANYNTGPNEETEEGETYRNYRGVCIPILRSQKAK